MKNNKIKILIVDDSIVIQKLLSRFISPEKDFEIVSVCSDPFQASQVLSEQEVDCMILDLELPKMDGVTFLKKLKQSFEVKTIVLSSLINSNVDLREKLKSMGALDAFPKPNGSNNEQFFSNLIQTIRSSKDIKSIENMPITKNSDLVFIASSTGSTDSIKKIMMAYDEKPPTLVIVQHMAADFTEKFAKSLNLVSKFDVLEAHEGLILKSHTAYIAPGNFHLRIKKLSTGQYCFSHSQETHIHGVRPAADYTLNHYPEELAENTTVVILSGMGKDGAAGLAKLKDLGAFTIAESERTSVVFGMPKAAIETGKVDQVLDLNEIVDFLITNGKQDGKAA